MNFALLFDSARRRRTVLRTSSTPRREIDAKGAEGSPAPAVPSLDCYLKSILYNSAMYGFKVQLQTSGL